MAVPAAAVGTRSGRVDGPDGRTAPSTAVPVGEGAAGTVSPAATAASRSRAWDAEGRAAGSTASSRNSTGVSGPACSGACGVSVATLCSSA